MTDRAKWGRILLEVAVIVGSILLAFAIDAMWDARQVRAAENELLSTLREEAVRNRDQLSADLELVITGISDLESFLAMTPGEAAALNPEEIWPRLGQPLYRSYVNELSFTAVTAAVNSGALASLGTPKLRELIGNEQRRHDDADEVRFSLTRYAERANERAKRLPEFALATTPEAYRNISRETLAQLRQDQELAAIVSAKVMYWRSYTGFLTRSTLRMDSIMAEIDGPSGR